jgi:hypothetical protein
VSAPAEKSFKEKNGKECAKSISVFTVAQSEAEIGDLSGNRVNRPSAAKVCFDYLLERGFGITSVWPTNRVLPRSGLKSNYDGGHFRGGYSLDLGKPSVGRGLSLFAQRSATLLLDAQVAQK